MATPIQGTPYQGASYQGNATSLTQGDAAAAPVIRTIGLSDLHRALQLGWEDFKAVPSHAIILCVIYPVLGLVLARTVLGYSVLPLLFPLAAGFALLGPFAALGLYEMSRRRETGAQASAWDALEVLRSPSFGAMLGLGVLLLALFVTWVATAQAIYGTLCVGLAIALLTFVSGMLYARVGGEAFLVMAALCLLALPICAGLRAPRETTAWRQP